MDLIRSGARYRCKIEECFAIVENISISLDDLEERLLLVECQD